MLRSNIACCLNSSIRANVKRKNVIFPTLHWQEIVPYGLIEETGKGDAYPSVTVILWWYLNVFIQWVEEENADSRVLKGNREALWRQRLRSGTTLPFITGLQCKTVQYLGRGWTVGNVGWNSNALHRNVGAAMSISFWTKLTSTAVFYR